MRQLLIQLFIALGAIATVFSSSAGADRPIDSVIYREDWERGHLGAQWTAQCNNLVPPYVGVRGSLTIQKQIVGQGRWAARFDLPLDARNTTACEIIHDRTLDLGTVDYYALAVFFPRGWKEPGDLPRSFWGMAIAQFNYQLITAPPVGLFAHRRYVNLVIQSGYFDGHKNRWRTGNGTAYGNLPSLYAIPRPLKLGVWHHLIVRVRWSTANDGAVNVWHRTAGKHRWRQTVRFRAKPTVQWSLSKPAVTGMPTWDKLGGYRGESSWPASIWHDAFCRAANFRAAQSCLS